MSLDKVEGRVEEVVEGDDEGGDEDLRHETESALQLSVAIVKTESREE